MIVPIALLSLLHGGLIRGPSALVVTTPRGESRLPVMIDPFAGPVVAAPELLAALNATVQTTGAWATVTVAHQPFRFLLGAPTYRFNDRLEPLAGAACFTRDTLFLPFQFIAEILPRVFTERFRYDADLSRLVEIGPRVAGPAPAPVPSSRLPNGLKRGHTVVVDPGHGGVDPGNPGLYFPRGITEKNVTLQIGLLLREELTGRGIGVQMTRTTDTLIDLDDRGPFCSASCDLFLSIHINSLSRHHGFTATRGFESYFLAEAKTEDAVRVEAMENEAIRYETPRADAGESGNLDFIRRDLQQNEYLRESARFAELIQEYLAGAHTGEDRGVKQAAFRVLTTARRPAVLAELGYSTNPQDGRLLTDRKSQRALAAALADAVVAYLLEYERKTGGPVDSGENRR